MNMIKALGLLIAVACCYGCIAHPPQQMEELFKIKTFTAPLNKLLTAETGDALFVEGEYIEGEAIRIAEPVDIMLPGSMLVPFPVYIGPGLLHLTKISRQWKCFCADQEMSAASFPGLGSVVRDGDCIGIRISIDNQERQWMVDNSNYNRPWGETIWTRSMTTEEARKYAPFTTNRPFKVRTITRLVFDGFYGDQLHFSWEDISEGLVDRKDFTFDIKGLPLLISIKGNRFVVHEANTVGLVYEWVHIASRRPQSGQSPSRQPKPAKPEPVRPSLPGA